MIRRNILACIGLVFLTSTLVVFECSAQTSSQRQISVFGYEIGADVKVPLIATPKYPKLRGELDVKRTQRSGTKVELKIQGIPAVLDLGGIYTTYVIWTVGADGITTNVGSIKTDVRGTTDTSQEFVTSLASFGVIVSAEPFAKVRRPSPMLMLQNDLTGSKFRNSIIESKVSYNINASDFFDDEQIVGSSEKAYRKKRPELLRAERALSYASHANADNFAPELYKRAQEKLQALQNDLPKKLDGSVLEQRTVEIEDLAAQAEAEADRVRSANRQQQTEERREREQKDTEQSLAYYKNQNEQQSGELQRERDARDSALRQVQDLRQTLSSLDKDLGEARAENAGLKTKLAESENERARLQKRLTRLADLPMIRKYFETWFRVDGHSGGLRFALPDSIWRAATSEVNSIQLTKLELPFRRIGEMDEFAVVVSMAVSSADDATNTLADERFAALAGHLRMFGIENSRIKFEKKVPPATPAKSGSRIIRTEVRIDLL